MKICSNCKQENISEAVFCVNCGESLDNNPVEELRAPLDVFVGKKAEYYDKKWKKADEKNGISFNVASFFFSFLWLGYRKVYKPIIWFAIAFLLVDLVLFLVGYEYSLTSFINPIDRGISIGVTVTFAMFGNKIYKDYALKQIKLIDDTTDDITEREQLYAKKGGTSWLGVLIAIAIMLFIYIIPTFFIPMNTNSIEEIQHSEIAYSDYDGDYQIKMNELLNIAFDDGKWSYTDKSALGKNYVTFEGKLNEDGETSHVIISFYDDKSTDYIDIIGYQEDDEEWEFDDQLDVLDYLLFYLE